MYIINIERINYLYYYDTSKELETRVEWGLQLGKNVIYYTYELYEL
jgi:hypothetical protein